MCLTIVSVAGALCDWGYRLISAGLGAGAIATLSRSATVAVAGARGTARGRMSVA